MARPIKRGLSYFSLDIDIFEDDKLFDVQNQYGPLGEVIYLRLLCLIYKNGYYYKFESLDQLSALLIKSIGNKWVRDKQVVKQVIPFLAKNNLFSTELMQENVLTSASIQRRYLKATERRQPMNMDMYVLIDENGEGLVTEPINRVNVDNNGINVGNNSINVCENPINKSKVNKNKVNKRRALCAPSLDEIKAYCQQRENDVDPQKFYDYFQESDWVDSKGNKVRNWKQKVIAWEGTRNGRDTATKNASAKTSPRNRFCNYEGREWDYALLEELEREHIKKRLGDEDGTGAG